MKVFEKNYKEVFNENYCSLDFDVEFVNQININYYKYLWYPKMQEKFSFCITKKSGNWKYSEAMIYKLSKISFH